MYLFTQNFNKTPWLLKTQSILKFKTGVQVKVSGKLGCFLLHKHCANKSSPLFAERRNYKMSQRPGIKMQISKFSSKEKVWLQIKLKILVHIGEYKVQRRTTLTWTLKSLEMFWKSEAEVFWKSGYHLQNFSNNTKSFWRF